MHRTADIQKRPHQFLPANFELTQWESLEPYFKALLDREITNKLTLESWMQDLSELEAFVSEDACWRQIKMTCDTTDKSLEEAFNYYCIYDVREQLINIHGKVKENLPRILSI